MTSTARQATSDDSPRSGFDPMYIVLGLALLALTVLVWSVARDRIVEPFDRFVTEQHCLDRGKELEREVIGFERSNRFGLQNRSVGYCQFGVGASGEAPMTLTIEQTSPGPLYRSMKVFGIVIQLGIASIFLRLIVDPVFDIYRAIRRRR